MRLRRKTYAQEERRAFVSEGIRSGRKICICPRSNICVQEKGYESKKKSIHPRRRTHAHRYAILTIVDTIISAAHTSKFRSATT